LGGAVTTRRTRSGEESEDGETKNNKKIDDGAYGRSRNKGLAYTPATGIKKKGIVDEMLVKRERRGRVRP